MAYAGKFWAVERCGERAPRRRFCRGLLFGRVRDYNTRMYTKILFVLVTLTSFFLFPGIGAEISILEPALVIAPTISLYPTFLQQGDPLLIVVDNPSRLPPRRIKVGADSLEVFPFRNNYAALLGINLNSATGTRKAVAVLSGGKELTQEFTIAERTRVTLPLGIPQKLGGNTKASQAKLAATLAGENKRLEDILSEKEVLWTEDFLVPLASTTVTDVYGYSRLTGDYTIPHKGVDFRAAKGTPVLAMNRGLVRLAEPFVVYGNTVTLDHGLGVHTLYMHLSKMRVSPEETVERGQIIGLSGDSGYAEFPHLHISVRIGGVSIDPLVFLSLFQVSEQIQKF